MQKSVLGVKGFALGSGLGAAGLDLWGGIPAGVLLLVTVLSLLEASGRLPEDAERPVANRSCCKRLVAKLKPLFFACTATKQLWLFCTLNAL